MEPAPPSGEITFAQIRERAYDLWERHHRPEDFSIALWLMAERELRAERDGRFQPDDARALSKASARDRPDAGRDPGR